MAASPLPSQGCESCVKASALALKLRGKLESIAPPTALTYCSSQAHWPQHQGLVP